MNVPGWFFAIPPIVWLFAADALAIALSVWGYYGRRVGSELRCRGCRYELRELTSERCPECGRADVWRRPRVGVRKVRWVAFSTGLLLSAGLGAAGGWMLSSANWRGALPVAALISIYEHGDELAGAELNRRVCANGLSAAQADGLANAALRILTRVGPATGRHQTARMLLSRLDAVDRLSDDQWQQMHGASVVALDVKAAEHVRAGENIPIVLNTQYTWPGLSWFVRIRGRDGQADGSWTYAPFTQSPGFGVAASRCEFDMPHALPVGELEVELELVGLPAPVTMTIGVGGGAVIVPGVRPSERRRHGSPILRNPVITMSSMDQLLKFGDAAIAVRRVVRVRIVVEQP